MNSRFALAALATGLLALGPLVGGIADAQTGPLCAAAKKKLAGKKDKKLLACDATAVGKGGSPDADCKQKARDAFSTGWDKAEAKGGCFTTNDKNTIEGKVDAHVQDMESTLQVTGSTPSKCSSKKFKGAGKKALCLLVCHGKAQKKGLPLSDPTIAECMQKCRDKFSAAFAKAEEQLDCRTTNDTAAVETKIDTFTSSVASMLPTGVVTTTTTTTSSTLPGTRCCQATGACFDASTSDAMVKCPLLHGTLAPSGQKCNGQTGTCGNQKVVGANCCQCPANQSQGFPHPTYCFDTNISSCGSVCTKTVGAACGPSTETCGGQ